MKAGVGRTVNSSRWAAYGDALGFVTELADEALVRRRIGTPTVNSLQPWKRKVGGKFGVDVQLPAGAYSDDTQLRLAVSRAIRGDGTFNVDAFAKIELPVWSNYALGAGRGSKAAASALTRADASWANNDFASRGVRYTDVGGNGAAMRIQPHVWASRTPHDPQTFLLDVIRNSICTHGHVRGILGAAFHSMLLARALTESRVLDPSDWRQSLDELRQVPQLLETDEQLSMLWVPMWQRASGRSFTSAWDEGLAEAATQIGVAASYGAADYGDVVKELGGFDPKTRGSGTGTAIIGAFAAHAFYDEPAHGLNIVANTLGSDTDSIATMAGALVGASFDDAPPEPVQDQKVLDAEAERLWALSDGQQTETFVYPDLLNWSPPKAQMDFVGVTQDGSLAMAGLGPLQQISDATITSGKPPTAVMWAQMRTDQTILIKMRAEPVALRDTQLPADRLALKRSTNTKSVEPSRAGNEPLNDHGRTQDPSAAESELAHRRDDNSTPSGTASVEELVASIERSHFSPDVIGRAILSQIKGGRYDVERAAALAGLIARARGNASNSQRSDHDS